MEFEKTKVLVWEEFQLLKGTPTAEKMIRNKIRVNVTDFVKSIDRNVSITEIPDIINEYLNMQIEKNKNIISGLIAFNVSIVYAHAKIRNQNSFLSAYIAQFYFEDSEDILKLKLLLEKHNGKE